MNQILYEDVPEKSTDINKIIRFFAIAIIIFGVALVAGGVYGFVGRTNSSQMVEATKPKIYVSTYEEESIQIKVTHDKPIEKIIYTWNDEEEITINGNKGTQIEELIDWPEGENELNIRVIDINGVEESYKQTYLLNYGVDIEKPIIKFSEPVDNKIVVTATDETELQYLTYRWNDEDETTIEETDASKTIITATIPIMEGENTLTVTAVDNNNNQTKEEKIFKAYKKPVIEVHQFGQELQLIVKDETGIDNIEYTVNDKKQTYQATSEEKEWKQTLQLQPGETKVVITVTNVKEISNTFKGKCVYNP